MISRGMYPLILAGALGVTCSVSQARVPKLITRVDRTSGSSGMQAPIGPFGSDADPLPSKGRLADGLHCYSDQPYLWEDMVPEMAGREYVRTFNSDQADDGDVNYAVTISPRAAFWLALDDRFGDSQQSLVDGIVADFAPSGTFTDSGHNLYVGESPPRALSVFAASEISPGGTYNFRYSARDHNYYVFGVGRTPVKPLPATPTVPLRDKFLIRAHTYNDFTLPYRLFVPDLYDPNRHYPAVLALHGGGKIGDDNVSHLNNKILPWADVEIQINYPSFVIAPQCPWGHGWTSEDVRATVFDMMDSLAAEFSIDQRKIYISGGSMGGYGAWILPVFRPYQFTASVPISGGGRSEAAAVISHIPFWVIHGKVDDVVPVDRSRAMIAALEQLGRSPVYTHCNLLTDDCTGLTHTSIQEAIDAGADLFYSEYPNERHNIGNIHFGNARLLSWLYQQEKPDLWFAAQDVQDHLISATVDMDSLIYAVPTSVTIDVAMDMALVDSNDFVELVVDVSQHNRQGDVFVSLQEITPFFYSVTYTLSASRIGPISLPLLLKSHAGQTYPLAYLELYSFEGLKPFGVIDDIRATTEPGEIPGYNIGNDRVVAGN